ncbi:ribonuclease D [Acetobacteraceae bacterium]|nr:ribonuclease D [Acetobacteraceae bacterium]
MKTPESSIHFYKNDLPDGLNLGSSIAVDTETMGLNLHRDRLCLVQISPGDGSAHLVQLIPETLGGNGYNAPNLKRLLSDQNVTKIMHFARFDLAAIWQYLNVVAAPVVCTKIAARLTRTFTDRHGLAALCRDLLNVELSKQQQTSDWGNTDLTSEQLHYAASDVLYLHKLWQKLENLLERENRLSLAKECFEFLPSRAKLDLMGYDNPDIFSHKA